MQTSFPDPNQARTALNKKMATLNIVLFPLIAIFYLIKWLTHFLGIQHPWYRLLTSRLLKKMDKAHDSAFHAYTPTEKDVFICSYYKSGTNWTMQIAYQIANLGEGEFEHIHDVVAWPDAMEAEMAVNINDERSKKSQTGLRVIKTHVHADSMPYDPKSVYICVVRNPKDVFTSSYHFSRSAGLGYLMPSVNTWLKSYMSPKTIEGPWANFTAGYWEWRDRPNVLFITFEEMKKDLKGAVRKIAKQMKVELTAEQLEQVCHKSSYKYMKQINSKFYPGRITPMSLKDGQMIRKGKSGVGNELLTPEQLSSIDTFMQTELKKLNSDFPYQEYYKKQS